MFPDNSNNQPPAQPDMPDASASPAQLPPGLPGGQPGPSPIPGLGAQPAPQPSLPDAPQPGQLSPAGALPIPGSAPGPTQLDPMQSLKAQMQALKAQMDQERVESAERRKQHEQFLQQVISTNGLEQFLPKPSAKQMLSDAMTNFGMARLTGGNFTPIQTHRFDEAFRRHAAVVQNAQLMLQNDHQNEAEQDRSQAQMVRFQQLAEKQQNDEAKQTQAQAETERKRAASAAALDFKDKYMRLVNLPANASKAEASAAKADLDSALANQAKGGTNIWGVTRNLMDQLEAAGQLPDDPMERLKMQQDILGKFKDATTRFNPNAGNVSVFKTDADNNMMQITGRKDGSAAPRIQMVGPPPGVDDVSWGKIGQPAKTSIDQIGLAQNLGQSLKELLENTKVQDAKGNVRALKDVGDKGLFDALSASAAQRSAYQHYIRGIGNKNNLQESVGLAEHIVKNGANLGDDEAGRALDKIIQYAALLKVAGSAQYLKGSRNFEFVKQIQAHLPDEKTNTGALMYEKLNNLMPQWDDMKRRIVQTELHPVTAGSAPPRGTPSTPPPAGKKDTKKAEVITDPSQIKW